VTQADSNYLSLDYGQRRYYYELDNLQKVDNDSKNIQR